MYTKVPENELECFLSLARMSVISIPTMETLNSCWRHFCRRVKGSSGTTVAKWGYRLEMRVLKRDIISVGKPDTGKLTVGGRSGCWEGGDVRKHF